MVTIMYLDAVNALKWYEIPGMKRPQAPTLHACSKNQDGGFGAGIVNPVI